MNRKIRIDQALDYILEPGSDSELSELSDSESEEEPTLQPPRIQDDEIEDTNANTNDPSGESENEESMSHLPDETNERNHVFRWRSSKPSSGDYLFKGKSLTVTFTVPRNLERQSKSPRRKLNNSSVFRCTCLF